MKEKIRKLILKYIPMNEDYSLAELYNVYYYQETYNKGLPAGYTLMGSSISKLCQLGLVKYDIDYHYVLTEQGFDIIRNNFARIILYKYFKIL